MSGKNQESDPSADDLVDLTADLLKGIAAEPVPQHLVVLAQQLQAALERQVCGSADMPEAGQPDSAQPAP